MLATANRAVVTEDSIVFEGRVRPVEHFYQDGDRNKPLKEDYDLDRVLPDRAIIAVEPTVYRDRREREVLGRRLYRAVLATEAVRSRRRLVLLGDPGGGKSTFLRHLAWALAQRGLDALTDKGLAENKTSQFVSRKVAKTQRVPVFATLRLCVILQRGVLGMIYYFCVPKTTLFGWDDTTRWLPILLPLRKLAGRIAAEGAEPATVSAVLRDEMTREPPQNPTHPRIFG